MALVVAAPKQQQELQAAKLHRHTRSVAAGLVCEVNSMAVGLLAGTINDNQPANSGVAQAAGT